MLTAGEFAICGVIAFVSLTKKVLLFHSEFIQEGSCTATANQGCPAKVVTENIASFLSNKLARTVCQ